MSCVTAGESLSLSEPRFPDLKVGAASVLSGYSDASPTARGCQGFRGELSPARQELCRRKAVPGRPGFQVNLRGSSSQCQGQIEVLLDGRWHTVDSRSWGQSPGHQWHPSVASPLCQKMKCREALLFGPVPSFSSPRNHITCHGTLGSFSRCNASDARQGEPLSLICLEPLKTTPAPTRPLPTTTPEPAAPPRLRLVPGPGGLRCAGVVEFYSGRLGGTVGYEDQDSTEALGDPHLRDFQPQVQSRLVGGSSVCAGSVEVRQGQGRQWEALCHSPWAKSMARWAEVCREQQCGPANSYQVLEAGEKDTRGLVCFGEKLSQCHQLQERRAHCKRVFLTWQDPNPAGLGTRTVMSIILALVLLAVLLVTCGPLIYKKLVKKFCIICSVSFHRDHGTTVRRSQVENPTAAHLENEYSQPPRNSQLSAYPALEGALRRVSAQPDNSSDSDYDLHGAQRL
ncbi:T-cell surface glycoprotein CD5 [Myotis lucifugus]|uniref:T-cell surface glycoprotein CD5 n=1 Tax=Myotis lucifugus TaxID=59463 RepID=UPI000CCC8AD8|nr:T-cell surface glycoprotein CD5 [Myotis lucifugus]